jgi:hypothetical protein
VEGEFLLDSLLECCTLLHRERVGFGDDGDDVDDVRELLEDDNVDGFEPILGQYTASCRCLDHIRMP